MDCMAIFNEIGELLIDNDEIMDKIKSIRDYMNEMEGRIVSLEDALAAATSERDNAFSERDEIRRKYTERFMNGDSAKPTEEKEEEEKVDEESITIDDLFEEKED